MEDNKFIREYDEKGNITHTRYSDGYMKYGRSMIRKVI